MGDPGQQPRGYQPLPVVTNEADLLKLALQWAAEKGDPDPELIQHTRGTREAVTKTTGSWVRSDDPSYIIAMRGKFKYRLARRPFVPGRSHDDEDDFVACSVQVLVVNVETGRTTDSGGGDQYPDLASVGSVVTDHPSTS
jgi:hypothetical protein